jgi:hypothetical protein
MYRSKPGEGAPRSPRERMLRMLRRIREERGEKELVGLIRVGIRKERGKGLPRLTKEKAAL